MRMLEKQLLILALTMFCMRDAYADSAPFSLTISTPINRIKSGEDVIVDVMFKNISIQQYSMFTSHGKINAEELAHISVKRADGKTVKETDYGRLISDHPPAGSMGLCVLNPGDGCNEVSKVSALYDMKTPGTYIIQVDRAPDEGGAVVKSNIITLQVTR